MAFDPDQYLASVASPAPSSGFDPDAYLAGASAPAHSLTPTFTLAPAPAPAPRVPTEAENLAFIRRTTPELIESEADAARRQKAVLDTPIKIKIDVNRPDPKFTRAPVGQLFADDQVGYVRKVNDNTYIPERPGFLADVRDLALNLPTAIMTGQFRQTVGQPLQNIAENPEVRGQVANIVGAIEGAEAGAPLGPAGVILGGIGGSILAEPYVQSQLQSTPLEQVTRILSGGLNQPVAALDRALAGLSPRAVNAIEQGLIGSTIAGTQEVSNAITEGRDLNAARLGQALLVGGATGAGLGGAIGGTRAPVEPIPQPALQVKQQGLANTAAQAASSIEKGGNVALQPGLNQITGTPEISVTELTPRQRQQAELEATFGTAGGLPPVGGRAAESAAAIEAETARLSAIEQRIQSAVDQLAGGDQAIRAQILGRRRGIADEDFLSALESAIDFQRRPQAQPDTLAAAVNAEAQRIANAPITPETPGVNFSNINTGVPAELQILSDINTAAEADRLAAGQAGVTVEELRARRAAQQMVGEGAEPTVVEPRQPTQEENFAAAEVAEAERRQAALAERAAGMEQALAEQERMLRSPQGAANLAAVLGDQAAIGAEERLAALNQQLADLAELRRREQVNLERAQAVQEAFAEKERLRAAARSEEELAAIESAWNRAKAAASEEDRAALELVERKAAMERGLAEQDQLRQSARGGAFLRQDLARQEAGLPPQEPVATTPAMTVAKPAVQLPYDQIPGTNGGLYLSADLARPHVPGYDPANPNASHPAAAAEINKAWDAGLQRDDVEGVTFLAGGAGAGKSAAMNGVDTSNTLVLDSTFSAPASLTKVEQAVATGKPVEIIYTQRGLEEAYAAMVLRALKGEQPMLSFDQFLGSHKNAVKNVLTVLDKYRDNPNVTVRVLDNTVQNAAPKVVAKQEAFLKRVKKNIPANEDITPALQRIGDDVKATYEAEKLRAANGGEPAPSGPGAGRPAGESGGGAGAPAAAPVTVKRASNFRDTGEYEVSNGQQTVNIFRDPENGWWYFTEPANVHFSQRVAGFKKTEAVAAAIDRLRSQRGATAAETIFPVGGAAAGGAAAFASAERQPGETEQEFQLRRLGLTLGGAALGAVAGRGASALARRTGGRTNAIQVESPTTGLLREETPRSQQQLGLQEVREAQGQAQVTGRTPEGMPEAKAQALRDAAADPSVVWQYTVMRPGMGLPDAVQVDAITSTGQKGSSNPADLQALGINLPAVPDWVPQGQYTEAQLRQMIEQRTGRLLEPSSEAGVVLRQAIAPTAGGAAGAVTGLVGTERQPGETEEQFQARRLRNAAVLAGAGFLGTSAAAAAARRIRVGRAPVTTNRELASIRETLKPTENVESLSVRDLYYDMLTRLNSARAPIEKMQRSIFGQAGKKFVAGKYYDLADRAEALSGSVVQAQREAGQIANLVGSFSDSNLQSRFPEYLVLKRIEDRMRRMPEERARLEDQVGIAEAELDAAKQKFAGNRTLQSAASVNARKADLREALKALDEEADRLRVNGWSLDDPNMKNPTVGLDALKQEVGPQKFAEMEQKGQEFQSIMLDNLRDQVDSGRMSQETFNAIANSSDFYAPFKVLRHYENVDAPTYGGSSMLNSRSLIQKITGIDDADLKLANPLEPAFEQVYKGRILSANNRFLRELATLTRLDPNGDFIRMLGPNQQARQGYQAVPFLRNGQVQRMEVPRDVYEALNVHSSLAEKTFMMNTLKAGSTLFKAGATALNVPFQFRNAFSFDPARLAIMSKMGIKNPVDAMKLVAIDLPVGLWTSIRTSAGRPNELGEKWLSSGAANSTFSRALTPESFAKSLPREENLAQWGLRTGGGLKWFTKAAAQVGSVLENSTKITGLKRALEGKDYERVRTVQTAQGPKQITEKVNLEELRKTNPVAAERAWKEIVHEVRNYAGSPDFSRMGTDMGIMNVVLPFSNARWQGFASDANRLLNREDSAGTAARLRLLTLVGLPAAGLAAWNLRPDNKEDYDQLPERERMRGFHVPLYTNRDGSWTFFPRNMDGSKNPPRYSKDPDGNDVRDYFVMPKREMPQLMANSMEGFVNFLQTEDPEAFRQIGNTLLNTAAPVSLEGRNADERVQSAMSGINPIIRTPMEVALNRDMFRQRNIIPESQMPGLQTRPDLAYAPSTPQVYKDIAGYLPDIVPSRLRSPAVVQKIIEDATGGFTRQFINPANQPDLTAFQRLTRGFRRSANMEMADVENAMEASGGEAVALTTRERELAANIMDNYRKSTRPDRDAVLSSIVQQGVQNGQINQNVYRRLAQDYKEEQLNYTPEEKRINNLSKRQRAFYYLDRLNAMDKAKIPAYLQDARGKQLLDPEVEALIIQLKNQPK